MRTATACPLAKLDMSTRAPFGPAYALLVCLKPVVSSGPALNETPRRARGNGTEMARVPHGAWTWLASPAWPADQM